MKKPESLIDEKIIAWIKEQGGDAWKVHGSAMQRTGEPDIDGWLPGILIEKLDFMTEWVPELPPPTKPVMLPIHLKIESKQPGEWPTQLQAHRLKTYAQAGYCVGCAHSLEEFIEIVENFKKGKL